MSSASVLGGSDGLTLADPASIAQVRIATCWVMRARSAKPASAKPTALVVRSLSRPPQPGSIQPASARGSSSLSLRLQPAPAAPAAPRNPRWAAAAAPAAASPPPSGSIKESNERVVGRLRPLRGSAPALVAYCARGPSTAETRVRRASLMATLSLGNQGSSKAIRRDHTCGDAGEKGLVDGEHRAQRLVHSSLLARLLVVLGLKGPKLGLELSRA